MELISTSPEHQAELRVAIVREAYEWLGTRYVNCGAIKGLNGAVDCAMLLCRVFQAVGIVPADYDPRPYNPNWHLHQNEKRYLAGLEKYAHQIRSPGMGDIAMYRFGRHASHGAILVSDDLLIHAHKRAGQVELCERRAMDHWFDSYWSCFSGTV